MAGTTCDAADCDRAVDEIYRIVRPDWMLEEFDHIHQKQTKWYVCSRHGADAGEGVSAEFERVA